MRQNTVFTAKNTIGERQTPPQLGGGHPSPPPPPTRRLDPLHAEILGTPLHTYKHRSRSCKDLTLLRHVTILSKIII